MLQTIPVRIINCQILYGTITQMVVVLDGIEDPKAEIALMEYYPWSKQLSGKEQKEHKVCPIGKPIYLVIDRKEHAVHSVMTQSAYLIDQVHRARLPSWIGINIQTSGSEILSI